MRNRIPGTCTRVREPKNAGTGAPSLTPTRRPPFFFKKEEKKKEQETGAGDRPGQRAKQKRNYKE